MLEHLELEQSDKEEVWMDLKLVRRAATLSVWVKTDPRVEEFVKGLANGAEPIALRGIGRAWRSPIEELMVYQVQKARCPATPQYRLGAVCGNFSADPGQPANLSFLQFVGTSVGEGVRFQVSDYPYSKSYVKTLSKNLVSAAYELFREYVVPVNIQLIITSRETV